MLKHLQSLKQTKMSAHKSSGGGGVGGFFKKVGGFLWKHKGDIIHTAKDAFAGFEAGGPEGALAAVSPDVVHMGTEVGQGLANRFRSHLQNKDFQKDIKRHAQRIGGNIVKKAANTSLGQLAQKTQQNLTKQLKPSDVLSTLTSNPMVNQGMKMFRGNVNRKIQKRIGGGGAMGSALNNVGKFLHI